MIDLNELERIDRNAAPNGLIYAHLAGTGAWEIMLPLTRKMNREVRSVLCGFCDESQAKKLVAAWNALSELLAYVRKLEKVVEAAKKLPTYDGAINELDDAVTALEGK